MTQVLITGGSGFIGRHLILTLLNRGWKVRVLVRKTTNTSWLKTQPIGLIEGDFSQRSSLKDAVQGVDYIFHLAAVIWTSSWQTYYQVNVAGTENLLAACKRWNPHIKKFIFVSSIAASGPTKIGIIKTEDDMCRPLSLYGKSKFWAEKINRHYAKYFPVAIVRPSNVLGPQQKELETVIKLIKNRVLPLLGKNAKQTSICFVEDVVSSLLMVAQNDKANGQTYFVTNDRHHSWREMLTFIARLIHGQSLVFKLPTPALYMAAGVSGLAEMILKIPPLVSRQTLKNLRNYYWLYSGKKIQRELGFSPKIKFEPGMKKIIGWYRENKYL